MAGAAAVAARRAAGAARAGGRRSCTPHAAKLAAGAAPARRLARLRRRGQRRATVRSSVSSCAPEVVVFGWLGSKQRTLDKYAHAWHSAGAASVRTVRPRLVELLRGRGGEAAAAARADLYAAGCARPPLIVAVHSHAGFLTAAAALAAERQRAAAEDAEQLPLAALVFDCSPAVPLTPETIGRGFAAAYANGWAQAPLQALANATLEALPHLGDKFARAESAMQHELERVPRQLYLCTPSDAVVRIDAVKAFAKRQRAAGKAAVRVAEFAYGTRHCELLKAQPDKYLSELEQLVLEVNGSA